MEWISINDRNILPVNYNRYLVWNTGYPEGYEQEIQICINGKFSSRVTHWAELLSKPLKK
jgi:hypothetical protein